VSGAVTPQSIAGETIPNDTNVLDRAIRVLRIEAEALSNLAILYQCDDIARNGLTAAVASIVTAQHRGGKLTVCGVGKSAFIGMKLVATCKSLGISASFLHACEAVHGDLGDIRPCDVVAFVSYSGKTPELMNLLPHIPAEVQVIALSSPREPRDCALLRDRGDGILLPTPIHESEEISFGVKAPTTSTTVALAVADMLALTLADEIHQDRTKDVFLRNHPGGAIGLSHRALRESGGVERDCKVEMVELPSPSISAESED
jgi:D-arabinose 5-phosphate isomerase GutQ